MTSKSILNRAIWIGPSLDLPPTVIPGGEYRIFAIYRDRRPPGYTPDETNAPGEVLPASNPT